MVVSDPCGAEQNKVIFVPDVAAAVALRTADASATVCCVEDKRYNKMLNATEHRVLKYLAGNKARFDALP